MIAIFSASKLVFRFGFGCFEKALGCLWWWPTKVFGEILPLLNLRFFPLGESTTGSFTLLLCVGFTESMLLYNKWWFGTLEWKPIAEFPPSPRLFTLLLGLFPLEVRGREACWLGAVVLSPLFVVSFCFLFISFLEVFTVMFFLEALICSLKYFKSLIILSISSSSTCSITLLLGLWWCLCPDFLRGPPDPFLESYFDLICRSKDSFDFDL